ncbi:hypothetical protein SRB5_63740 [Streptomyces sp. RB5]|uniref:Peptidase S8/S53 domain-containing protein n=2 Tax=Streptomyces smaragdinus TaxID=2585196 RepID=A0A7K0CRR6_9ACTN|nr:hypothetical protein [Streptomyces smaragdinus]
MTRHTGAHAGIRRAVTAAVAAAVAGASFIGLAPAANAQDATRPWYLDVMQAEKMWAVSKGEGVTVAVIDSGVGDTPALRGQVLAGLDSTDLSGDERSDLTGHGTTMAELIAGTGEGGGLQGLAPSAKILPIRIQIGNKEGETWVDPRVGAKAIRAAADSKARIINMSVAGSTFDGYTEEAIKYAASKGKLVFAGTGNDGSTDRKFPVSYPEVVGVGAVDKSGVYAKFSNYGKSVDLAAPGTEVPTYCDESLTRYCTSEGTSQATALASASAALIWSEHPEWTANQVLKVMIDTAGREDGKQTLSKYIGWGVVRPRVNLLEGKGDPGAPDVNPLLPAGSQDKDPSAKPSAEDKGADAKPEATEAAGAEAAKDDEGNGQLWTVLGIAAAVVVVGGGAFVLIRRRSTN